MADLSPSGCERIIIVGAGGFGREVLQWARHAWPSDAPRIAGFLSADPDKLDGHAPALPILGSPADFQPQPFDGFLLAIGVPRVRRQVAEQLEVNGARFLTLTHPTAIVAATAQVGTGTVICPYAIVSDAVRLGRFVLLNYHSSLGHDASALDFSVLAPYATLAGGAFLEEDVFLGLHAQIGPLARVGRGSRAEAGAVILRHLPEGSVALGPAPIRIPSIETSLAAPEKRRHAND
jgi:sugar O-acyltransferase (sialic acid O-acetyltransferase NeuD family)